MRSWRLQACRLNHYSSKYEGWTFCKVREKMAVGLHMYFYKVTWRQEAKFAAREWIGWTSPVGFACQEGPLEDAHGGMVGEWVKALSAIFIFNNYYAGPHFRGGALLRPWRPALLRVKEGKATPILLSGFPLIELTCLLACNQGHQIEEGCSDEAALLVSGCCFYIIDVQFGPRNLERCGP
ncbi:hypothetical protein GOP47_0028928 [Adiantum capillus-veneris]|nr:hypothetical protein GOP47_0028928 [Adiantum capillus-veneris]